MINKDKLKRIDTPWRDFLDVDVDVKPSWALCYKPPLTKNVGDLQWRILHGIIAVNAFISILNPNVQDDCPFCGQRETIFHCFMQCERLRPLFILIEFLFASVNEIFTRIVFIFGFKYSKEKKKGRLLNFILGQAKMATSISRKRKIECGNSQKVELFFKGLMKARIKHDFIFYSHMENFKQFEELWTEGKMLCWIEDTVLHFVDELE